MPSGREALPHGAADREGARHIERIGPCAVGAKCRGLHFMPPRSHTSPGMVRPGLRASSSLEHRARLSTTSCAEGREGARPFGRDLAATRTYGAARKARIGTKGSCLNAGLQQGRAGGRVDCGLARLTNPQALRSAATDGQGGYRAARPRGARPWASPRRMPTRPRDPV